MNARSILVCIALTSVACASTLPPPRIVRLRDLGSGQPLAEGQALIVELDEGDVIPLKLAIHGAFLETPADNPTVPIRVKRHCFVRLDKRGLKTSLDGKNFDWSPVAPGTFRIGLRVTKEGAQAEMDFQTPTPPPDMK